MHTFDIISVVQVTERCNLQCKYCFVPELTEKRMDQNVLERFTQQMLDYNSRAATFIWHGGEPLLRGKEFYENVLELQRMHNTKGIRVVNKIQTNGTPLNDELSDFLIKEEFHIGVSVDGPAEIHDQNRTFKNGKGSYALIKANLARLNANHGKILVLTKQMLGKEQEIYAELKSTGNGARINLYIPTGYGKGQRDELQMTPEEAGHSLIAFYELWKNDPAQFDLKPFTELVQGFVTGTMQTCEYSPASCQRIVGVSYEGKMYRCARGIPDIRNVLGNIMQETLDKIVQRIAPVHLSERQQALLRCDCGECKFYALCGGGCPQESLAVYGDFLHKTYYCESRKMLFEHVLRDLKNVDNLAIPA